MSARQRARIALAAVLIAASAAALSQSLFDKLKQEAGSLTGKKPGTTTEQNQESRETLDPASDRFCDSLGRSYSVTEDVAKLGGSFVKCKMTRCNPEEQIPKDPRQLEPWLRTYSQKHLWLPVLFEQNMGASFLDEQQKAGLVLEREAPGARKLYVKVDEALQAAKKSYPAIPYTLKVYIVDVSDLVNAQAVPGGYIFVTRAAAKDLDPKALEFVMGHEVAHLAKRHMSKQLQDRMIETDQAVELFQRMSARQNINQDADSAKRSVDRLQCSFAKYQQSQESQADACSARIMVESGNDPVAAWKDYARVRGTLTTTTSKSKKSAPEACVASSSAHPEDSTRESQLKAAAAHHHAKSL